MNDLAKLFTDETKLVFANGTVIEGAEKVTEVIVECCKAYTKGYLSVLIPAVGKGALVGVAVGGGVYFYTKHRANLKLKGEGAK